MQQQSNHAYQVRETLSLEGIKAQRKEEQPNRVDSAKASNSCVHSSQTSRHFLPKEFRHGSRSSRNPRRLEHGIWEGKEERGEKLYTAAGRGVRRVPSRRPPLPASSSPRTVPSSCGWDFGPAIETRSASVCGVHGPPRPINRTERVIALADTVGKPKSMCVNLYRD